jgi:hypothetical protein
MRAPLPVNGSMESFGYSVYPSWPQDTQRTRTILQSIDAEVRRTDQANVFLNGAGPAKHIRPVRPGRRKMSAAGRARIVAAQKARWAKVEKAGKYHCLLRFAGLQEQVSEALDRFQKIGLDSQRPGNTYRTFDQNSLLPQCIAKPEMCPFRLGIESHSLAIVGDGLG